MGKKIFVGLFCIIITAVLFVGCASDEAEEPAQNTTIKKETISKDEDQSNQKIISDYMIKMYSHQIDYFKEYSELGTIPEDLKSFIAKRTIDEGSNNTEIGLHYPRYVSLNGQTIIGYTPIMDGKGDKKQPRITSTFIHSKDNIILYYVKIDFKADCVPDDLFKDNYTVNDATNLYHKVSDVDSASIDNMNVQLNYDIEFVKEGDKYKIFRARESAYNQGARNRLIVYNNDFIKKLPYLDLTKTDDNSAYVNKADGDEFEKGKSVITAFFDNMLSIDNDRRLLLDNTWNTGFSNFDKLFKAIGLNKNKDGKEILSLGVDYRERFPNDALLINNGASKITLKDTYKVNLHPAYSKLRKLFLVSFDATVVKTVGSYDNTQDYTFDYLIEISGSGNDVKIKSVKLNFAGKSVVAQAN